MTRVTLIGLGEVGTVFAEDLAARGHADLVAWDIAFADPGSPAARTAADLPVATAAAAATAASGAGLDRQRRDRGELRRPRPPWRPGCAPGPGSST